MIATRTWAALAAVAVLALACLSLRVCRHVDDHAIANAHAAVVVATHLEQEQKHVVSRLSDSVDVARQRVIHAQHWRDAAQAGVVISDSDHVTVNGDSTPSVVIPALIQIIHADSLLMQQYDTLVTRQDTLHTADSLTVVAADARADSAAHEAEVAEHTSHSRIGVVAGVAVAVGLLVLHVLMH